MAEREGYFRSRREELAEGREQIFEEIGVRFGVKADAIKLWVNQFKKQHEQKMRIRRNARIVWRFSQGASIEEISKGFKLSISSIIAILKK